MLENYNSSSILPADNRPTSYQRLSNTPSIYHGHTTTTNTTTTTTTSSSSSSILSAKKPAETFGVQWLRARIPQRNSHRPAATCSEPHRSVSEKNTNASQGSQRSEHLGGYHDQNTPQIQPGKTYSGPKHHSAPMIMSDKENQETGFLTISARGLKNARLSFGKTSPYAVALIDPSKKKTTHLARRAGCARLWNRTLYIPFPLDSAGSNRSINPDLHGALHCCKYSCGEF
eukprot:Gb_00574 [translate_table: standard]